MKKFFDIKALKSSENCDKYSKSVSYETLVGGTTTIGRDRKQTRRLSKGSANKPLSAVDTLTSLLCNSAKVVEKWLQILPVFRLVKVLGLVAVLSVGIISESTAECVGATETTAGTDNITGAHCGICGTNCNWKIEGATLKVTGGANGEIGSMIDYGFKSAPWYSERINISSIEISGIKRIGNFAFASMPFEKLTITEDVKTIATASFAYDSHLKSVVIPTLAYLGYGAFYHNKLEEIIVSDEITEEKIKNWHLSAFAYNPEGLKIICQGNIATCQAVMQKYVEETCAYLNSSSEEHRNFCIQRAKFQKADYKQCLSANYYWNGVECLREPDVTKRKCCSDVCKDMGGFCNRIRYTPAEAAEVLHDDNTNEVTITFKK